MNIDIKLSWRDALSILLLIHENAETEEGRKLAFAELKKMAWLADQFGKPIAIEVFAMAGDSLAKGPAEYYDVLVRCDGEDPFEELENATWEEAQAFADRMILKYPSAGYEEISG